MQPETQLFEKKAQAACPACGYDITHTYSGKCPECGIDIVWIAVVKDDVGVSRQSQSTVLCWVLCCIAVVVCFSVAVHEKLSAPFWSISGFIASRDARWQNYAYEYARYSQSANQFTSAPIPPSSIPVDADMPRLMLWSISPTVPAIFMSISSIGLLCLLAAIAWDVIPSLSTHRKHKRLYTIALTSSVLVIVSVLYRLYCIYSIK